MPLRQPELSRHDARAEAVNPTSPSPIATQRVAETGSTNADLLAWARDAGASTTPRVLVAERQTAGRGRRGSRWHATQGASLTFSH